MCAAIDGGLARAQETADKAQADAQEAAKLPYVVGNYIGKASETQTIDIGFRPSAVLVWGNQSSTNSGPFYLFTNGANFFGKIKITDTGFSILVDPYVNEYPVVNVTQVVYTYLALR